MLPFVSHLELNDLCEEAGTQSGWKKNASIVIYGFLPVSPTPLSAPREAFFDAPRGEAEAPPPQALRPWLSQGSSRATGGHLSPDWGLEDRNHDFIPS